MWAQQIFSMLEHKPISPWWWLLCLQTFPPHRPGSPAHLSYDPVGCVTNVSLPDYAWYVQQDPGYARLIVLTLLVSCPFLRRPDGKDEGQELAAAACASYEPWRHCKWHMTELSLVPSARAASRMSACPILLRSGMMGAAEQAVFTAGSTARPGGTAGVCEAAAGKCQPCIRTEACPCPPSIPWPLTLCLPCCCPFNQFPLFSLIPPGFWFNSPVASRHLRSLWLMALLTKACMWEERAVMGNVVDVLYTALPLLKTQQECPLWGLHFFPRCLFSLLLISSDFPSCPGPVFAGVSSKNCYLRVSSPLQRDSQTEEWLWLEKWVCTDDVVLLSMQKLDSQSPNSLFTPLWMQNNLRAGRNNDCIHSMATLHYQSNEK